MFTSIALLVNSTNYKPILQKIFVDCDAVDFIIKNNNSHISIYRICNNKLTHNIVINSALFSKHQVKIETVSGKTKNCIIQFLSSIALLKFIATFNLYLDYDVEYENRKTLYYVKGNSYCNNLPKLSKIIKQSL
jgi:hypothetical protein